MKTDADLIVNLVNKVKSNLKIGSTIDIPRKFFKDTLDILGEYPKYMRNVSSINVHLNPVSNELSALSPITSISKKDMDKYLIDRLSIFEGKLMLFFSLTPKQTNEIEKLLEGPLEKK